MKIEMSVKMTDKDGNVITKIVKSQRLEIQKHFMRCLTDLKDQ